MTIDDKFINIERILSVLKNEQELIIKPFHSGIANEIGVEEYGKIVSRMNKPLLDYQIGNKANTSMISSTFHQRITLSNPGTKQVILELYRNRLPLVCKVGFKQDVRCLASLSNETESIGSIQPRLAFIRVWYDVYNNKHERVVSIRLRKSYLRSKIQYCVPEFEILDSDAITNIGRIYPYSTDFERSEYGHAVAMRIPQDMKVDMKATLLITALILKSRLN